MKRRAPGAQRASAKREARASVSALAKHGAAVLVAAVAAASCAPQAVDQDLSPAPSSPVDQRDAEQPPPLAMYPRTYAPSGASVAFLQPRDGAALRSPFTVRVAAANVPPSALRLHLLVDTKLPDERFPIPDGAGYLRFADGESAIDVELPAGEHELTLLLGDDLRIPHLPPVFSETLQITVIR